MAPDVNLEEIAVSESCQGFTGADLAALVREAGVLALKDALSNPSADENVLVSADHFMNAFMKIRPSVSEQVKNALFLILIIIFYPEKIPTSIFMTNKQK